MQLIAIDDRNNRVIATNAQKKIDYHCPQCGDLVRLRFGPRLQAHFYHFRKASPCQHRKKTLTHLQNQLYLAKKIPEAILEHSFPSIGRIADVYWPSTSIVFEIQYSPMSHTEAEKRESDYRSLGIELVWILHDSRYNKRGLSPVELFLSGKNLYYTSIGDQGSGMIYDQFVIIRNEKRCFKGARFEIDPTRPYNLNKLSSSSKLPQVFLQRLRERTRGFAGDLLDTVLKNPSQDFSSIIELEKRYAKYRSFSTWIKTITAIYRAFFYAILEKAFLR